MPLDIEGANGETGWLDSKLGEALKDSLQWHLVAIALAKQLWPPDSFEANLAGELAEVKKGLKP